MNPVRYQLQLLDSVSHYYQVDIDITPWQAAPLEFQLPAWIPGSYMIRDFARNLQAFSASDAQGELPLAQVDKQTWQLVHRHLPVRLTYWVYAFDLSVRANYFNDQVAVINPAAACLEVVGATNCHIRLSAPPSLAHWRVATGLARDESTAFAGFGDYHATNYQQLIDCPIVCGELSIESFTLDDVPHHVVVVGGYRADLPRFANDLAVICQQQRAVFGELPQDLTDYWFLTWVVDKGYGGLEHRNSTLLLCNRFDLPNPQAPTQQTDDYVTLLGLCSHEYFHTWWVKRARPKAFLQYQLQHEQYTDQLWLYEGFTSYFDDYALVRSGTISRDSYLKLLSETISRVTRAPSQHRQSLADSSLNAWTKYYKQDENAQNAVTNYYAKGSLVALCLEAQLQQRALTLTGFMQCCWQQFGRDGSGSDWERIAQCLLAYSQDSRLVTMLHHWVYGVGELPLQESLATLGIELSWRAAVNPQDLSGVKTLPLPPRAFGALYEFNTEGMRITSVAEYSAAKSAGLMAGDVVIAVDELKMTEHTWREVSARAGEQLRLHLFRQQRLLTVTLPFDTAPTTVAMLTIPTSAPEVLDRWLGTTPND